MVLLPPAVIAAALFELAATMQLAELT